MMRLKYSEDIKRPLGQWVEITKPHWNEDLVTVRITPDSASLL
jgi:hypothetical protein